MVCGSSRDHRNVDPGRGDFVAIVVERIVVVEQLGDDDVGICVNLTLKVLDVDIQTLGLQMLLWIACYGQTCAAVRILSRPDVFDQFVRVVEPLFVSDKLILTPVSYTHLTLPTKA